MILALRSPELEIVGVTSVSGNVSVGQATINALRVLELLDRKDVWVAKGLANPLIRDSIRAVDFHGIDGLGDSNLPLPKLKAQESNALDLVPETLASSRKGGIKIIATGPLTNIASILVKNPEVVDLVSELVIMGGAFGLTEYGYGNETPAAEFNIYSDPEAAKIVFESEISLKAVGLDVTMSPSAHLTRKDYAVITAGRTRTARFADAILSNSMRRWGHFALHDPMAVAAAVKPTIFQFEIHSVVIETKGEYTTGMTLVDRSGQLTETKRQRREVDVCTAAQFHDFKKLFLERLLT